MDIEGIKNNYARLDDSQLIHLATKEIKSLRKDVIPILADELAKRNISLETEEPKDNEENSRKEINKSTSKKAVMSQMTEFMTDFEMLNILKVGKKYFINRSLLFFISASFTLIILLLLSTILGGGSRLLILTLIASVLLTVVLRKLGLGKVAEVKPNTIVLSKYPSLNIGVFRILVLFQISINAVGKIELDYKNIVGIYQKNKLTDKGFYIETNDNLTKKDIRIFLEVLTEYDRKQIMKVLETKIMESKNEYK